MRHLVIKCWVMVSLFPLCGAKGFSQTTFTTHAIVSQDLPLTCTKTTNLLFPYGIVSVDRGSMEVLVQKAKGMDNVLQVKADRENIPETNLSVFTEDGTLYSFLVSYDARPPQLNYVFEKTHGAQNQVVAIQQTAEHVATLPAVSAIMQQHKFQMLLQLEDIWVHESVLYFPLRVSNRSTINYTVQSLRFFVRDKKAGKRTAMQELSLQPLYIYNSLQFIKGREEEHTVVALSGFTLPEGKQLWIEITEQNGGRNLRLRINNHRLLQAKRIALP